MPLIAIVKDHSENYSDGYYASGPIVTSITDWSEVTTKELQLLKNYLSSYDYSIIERIDVDKEFIPKTVAQAKLAEQKERERKEEAERKKLAAALKKKAKTEEQEKKLLEELQAKYKG